MGASTSLRLSVAIVLVWAALEAATNVGGLAQRWSPGLGGTIVSVALALVLPAMIAVLVWVLRRGPRWPRLDPERLASLLDADERAVALAAVRVAGTQAWRPALLFEIVGLSVLLGVVALSEAAALALVFLPLALLLVPFSMLGLALSNGMAERSARRGRRHSTARSVPPSRGRPPDWLVLTDRRLMIVGPGRGGRAELVWHVPLSELDGAEAARRSWRTLDRTIRVRFADGSSVRLAAPDAQTLLAASG